MIGFPPVVLALVLALVFPSSLEGGGKAGSVVRSEMVRIPAGSYLPHYSRDRSLAAVAAFELDRHPVTRAEYAEFVAARPNWRRSLVKPLFAASGYLAAWRDDLDFGGSETATLPVTQVSWFAARAYCEWQDKRLPKAEEWEYVASASETARDASQDAAFLQRLTELYTARSGPRPVGAGFRNAYGVHDLHGLVSEWVLDFNNVLVSDDSRASDSGHDRQLYCAAGGMQATNPANYPAFLRYAMRSGLDGRSTVSTLGFRCARSLSP